MAIVERITINEFPYEDKGVTVRETLKLIEDSPFKETLLNVFNLESIKNEFIEIPGALTLVESILNLEKKIIKIDIETPLKNVRTIGFSEDKQAILEISNIENVDLKKYFRKGMIRFKTAYSVRSDYYNQLYSMNKYLTFLLDNGFEDIRNVNIDMLEAKYKESETIKNFRLVIDEEGEKHVRALTSQMYKDYNIAFSVFVTLIQLHNLNRNKEVNFSVTKFTLTDSEIKVIFKNHKDYEFFDKSKISFSIVLSNDEIKREAVNLNGIFSIKLDNVDTYLNPLDPSEGKSNILSFPHKVNVSTVKDKLSTLNEEIESFIEDTLSDLKFVKEANVSTKIADVQNQLRRKIKSAQDKNFVPLKKEVEKIFAKKVYDLFELLELVNKVDDLFKDEYIQAQDYWRHKVYMTLIKRK